MESVIRMRPEDNVAVACQRLEPGHRALGVEVTETVAMFQKVALTDIPEGAPVTRYGESIGIATCDIKAGQYVHTHNVGFQYQERNYEYAIRAPQPPPKPAGCDTFLGFRRKDGRPATRNYLAVIASVNCSGHVPGLVAEKFLDVRRDYPNIDGVLPFTHQTGCGITMNDDAHEALLRTFAGTMNHPNIVGSVMVGLGCEQLDPSRLANGGLIQLGDLTKQGERGKPLPTTDEGSLLVSIQSHGGTTETVESVTRYLTQLLPRANDVKRVPIPAAEIILAMNCGGSDAYSGITANPALGIAADLLVALGGTPVLAETTETIGAEHLLIERARTPAVGEKLAALIRWWNDYYTHFTFLNRMPSANNNPSHGNKAGGLTTIVEKSLGAVAKGGTTVLEHVLAYAERIPPRGGLCFMDTPGKDSHSMTGLLAGGANVGIFTTGRGNVAGWAPMPTIKLCTNTPTYERIRGDMDLNAGGIVDGTISLEDMGLVILQKILAVASGERTASERLRADRACYDPMYKGPLV